MSGPSGQRFSQEAVDKIVQDRLRRATDLHEARELHYVEEHGKLREALLLGGIILAGVAAGLLPAVRAYRLSLADGMTVRV